MYDENLATLEEADYIADMFWLGGEESDGSFLFEGDNIIAIDRTAALIEEASRHFDNMLDTSPRAVSRLHDAAYAAKEEIENFVRQYNKLAEQEC